MNKTEFIKAVAEKADISAKQSADYFEAFTEVVYETLKSCEKISLTGFGSFELKSKAEREGINPKTKEKVTIAACNAPTFKFSKSFRETFN